MVPVDTCYKIVDIYSWGFTFVGTIAVAFVGLKNAGVALTSPVYWLATGSVGLQLPTTFLRGLPFLVRYGVLTGNMLVFTVCAAVVFGISPNWCFLVIMMLSSTGLIFGTRMGMLASGILCVIHGVIAWGWVKGYLPVAIGGAGGPAAYVNFHSADVWARVLVITAGFLAMLQLLMNYVLRNLSDALKEANSTLRSLAMEQEFRARAEEARLKAELAAREAQKFEALGRLAAGVAHDFNNALCVMKCWSSCLLEDLRDPLVVEAATAIKLATDNATQLTHHLLAFSRSDTGRKEVVDLGEVARLEGKTLARLLPKDVAVAVEAGAQVNVRIGRGQLQEIILNLAINARDAMPQGGRLNIHVTSVTLDVSTEGLPAGRYARMEVTDTGAGMDRATQARIFEPFFTTKPHGRGTGLGLAMVYGLVAAAGGSISVRSEPGRGSCFTLHLPYANPEEHQVEPPAEKIVTLTRCRVLVAEDEPELRLLIERILTREGFPVIAVADGSAAVAAMAVPGSKFGIFIVDGIMPGLPTSQVIGQAFVRNPDCRVIVASAHMEDQLLLRGIETGLYRHLAKPFDAGQLREAVNEVLAETKSVNGAAMPVRGSASKPV